MLDDFFDVGAAMVTRLQAEVPELVAVGNTSNPATFEDEKRAPSAWIVYDGYDVSSESKRTYIAQIFQHWVVGLVVQSPNDKYGSKGRASAGSIMPKIISALHGWKPAGIKASSRMWLVSAPGEVIAGGHTIYFTRYRIGVVN
jgi:hypothetical protein